MNVYEFDCGPQMLTLYFNQKEWGSPSAPLELLWWSSSSFLTACDTARSIFSKHTYLRDVTLPTFNGDPKLLAWNSRSAIAGPHPTY